MIRPTAVLAALALVLSALPAAAQWVAVGRWGAEGNFRYVPPGTWMVLQQDGQVEITAEGDNHQGRIELTCDGERPGGTMRFSGYFGDALDESALSDVEPHVQSVRFVIDGQSFDRTFRYRPDARDWVADDVLEPGLLDVFAWGQRFEILNKEGERVTSYGLSGSGAARQAVRRGCGI
ncbi:MAG: hypothetical protein KDK12_07355 [Rhodobacteraceae bacterium]|nr:hypothetical protein [Paracoccaceae bacterium]